MLPDAPELLAGAGVGFGDSLADKGWQQFKHTSKGPAPTLKASKSTSPKMYLQPRPVPRTREAGGQCRQTLTGAGLSERQDQAPSERVETREVPASTGTALRNWLPSGQGETCHFPDTPPALVSQHLFPGPTTTLPVPGAIPAPRSKH